MRGASIDPHGFDAGKKIKGKKRHLLVDTQGLLMQAIVHSADVQDRDGGALLLSTLLGRFPYLENCSPTAPIKGRSSPTRSPKSCLGSRSRSSNDPIKRKASSRCPSAGSSSERSPGSTAAEDWPRIGRTSTSQPSCSFVSPPSALCCEGYAIPRENYELNSKESHSAAALKRPVIYGFAAYRER